MNRRTFLKSTALTATSIGSYRAFGKATQKLKLGIVGTGNWGTEVLLKSSIATGRFEITGLCDVNTVSLAKAATIAEQLTGKRPTVFTNYKTMYDSGLDAVVIATPTHWHALHFIDACKRGLHVFLEKPVSYDIRESQAMLSAHKKAGNVVQVDFPRMKSRINAEVMSFIESGEAGKVYQVLANINHHEGQLTEKNIPPTLDYDTYCGPVEPPKFLCENENFPMWRGQRAFSRGILFDWGIHYIHNIRSVFNLDLPDTVMAMGGIVKNNTHDNPDHLDVQFTFGDLPVLWSHKTWGFKSAVPDYNYGIYYFGEKATIFAGDMGWEVFGTNTGTKTSYGDVRFTPGNPDTWQKYLKMAEDLFLEFAHQIEKKTNEGITNTLEEAVKTTATVIYADLAYTTRSNLHVNKSTMTLFNNDNAQALLKRDYRKPYQHPYN